MKKSVRKKKGEIEEIATIGQLKAAIKRKSLGWTVDDRLSDSDPLPVLPTGKPLYDDPVPKRRPSKEYLKILKAPPTNPFLRDRWVELGLLNDDVQNKKRK